MIKKFIAPVIVFILIVVLISALILVSNTENILGEVTDVRKNTITIRCEDGQEYTINAPNETRLELGNKGEFRCSISKQGNLFLKKYKPMDDTELMLAYISSGGNEYILKALKWNNYIILNTLISIAFITIVAVAFVKFLESKGFYFTTY